MGRSLGMLALVFLCALIQGKYMSGCELTVSLLCNTLRVSNSLLLFVFSDMVHTASGICPSALTKARV